MTGRHRWIIFTLLFSVHSAFLQAEETVYSASSRQDPLETAGISARAMAMGTAFVGVADDSTAVLWNPAGMAGIKNAEVSFHHFAALAGIRQDVIATSIPVGKKLGIGAYGHYVNYGRFDGADEDGVPTGTYSANQMGLGAGAALQVLEGLSVGLAMRANQQTLAGQSYALFNADAGLMIALDSGWRLGASYCNLGVSGKSEKASTAFRIGASQTVFNSKPFSLLMALAGTIEPRTGNNILLGLECGYNMAYFLRAGYRMRLREKGIDGLEGMTAGAGVQFKTMRLDYSFEPFGDVGATHRVSLVHQFSTTRMMTAPANAQMQVAVPVTVIQTVVLPATQPAPAVPAMVSEPVTVQSLSTGFVTPEPVQENAEPSSELMVKFALTSEDVTQGEELEKQGRNKEAFDIYLRAVQLNKENAKAWWKLGNIYYRSHMKEQAVRCFGEVVRLNPNDKALATWLENYKAQPATPAH